MDRLQNGSGQAIVELNGNHMYLGKFNGAESREKCRRLVAELTSPQAAAPVAPSKPPQLINRLILQFFCFANSYYVKNGKY
jgi:hypothetical protein